MNPDLITMLLFVAGMLLAGAIMQRLSRRRR